MRGRTRPHARPLIHPLRIDPMTTAALIRPKHPRYGRLRRPAVLLVAALAVALASHVVPPLDGRSPVAQSGAVGPRPIAAGPVAGVPTLAQADGLSLAQRIDFWAARVEQQPGDVLSLVQLAL